MTSPTWMLSRMLWRSAALHVSAPWRCLARGARPAHKRTLLTTAYIEGPKEPSLLEQTVPQHFASIVSQYGDRPAVISRHQQQLLTYDALDTASNALARGLENAGVAKGTRVAVSLGNNAEFATVTYACFKLGAILAPLNPAFTPDQIASALNHLSTTHLIIGAENSLPRRDPLPNLPTLQRLIEDPYAAQLESSRVPSLQRVILVDNSHGRTDVASLRATTPYENVLEDGGAGRPLGDRGLSPDDTVNIQFTSGTTSMPKAACLSHRSILNNGKSIGDRMLLGPEDVVVCPPPLFHCFGCILGYMATATHGSAIVFPTEAFDPHATLLAVQETRATALYGVPTMFLAELDLLSANPAAYDRTRFDRLRTGIAAGSQVPTALMRKLHANLGLTQLTICYGMTETSPVSAMTTTDDPLQKRVASVGRLLPHVKAAVVDPADASRTLAPGQPGELLVAGYLLMAGYWGDAARTAAAVHVDARTGERWMRTGDEALLDEDGYVVVTGRLSDVIIRGGENIHPLDVEDCLLECERVRESCAFGVPDVRYGEAVCVAAIRRGGRDGIDGKGGRDVIDEEGVRAWVRERLPRHFVPKHVLFVDALPKTPSGKIQRFKLREMAVKELGLVVEK